MEAQRKTSEKLSEFELQLWASPGLEPQGEPPEPGTPQPVYGEGTRIEFDVDFGLATNDPYVSFIVID